MRPPLPGPFWVGRRSLYAQAPVRPTPLPGPPQIKRTEGVSTTDIVGRMLMCSRDNARFAAAEQERLTLEFSLGNGDTGAAALPVPYSLPEPVFSVCTVPGVACTFPGACAYSSTAFWVQRAVLQGAVQLGQPACRLGNSAASMAADASRAILWRAAMVWLPAYSCHLTT